MKWIDIDNGMTPESEVIVIIKQDNSYELLYKNQFYKHKKDINIKYWMPLPKNPEEQIYEYQTTF